MNRNILILRIFLRKVTILRKILRIRIGVNTGPEGLSLRVRILQELQALNGRMTTIEDRVNQQDQTAAAVASPTKRQTSSTTSEPESDLMLPTMGALKRFFTVQAEVDSRLRKLSSLTDKGKFKSQRASSETVWVKRKFPGHKITF